MIDNLLPDILDIDVAFFACQPVGRAKNKFRDEQFIRDREPVKCFCKKGGTFSIDSLGNVWPCCSPYVLSTQLCVGNLYHSGIKQTYQSLENNIFLKLLRNHGFDYFIKIVQNFYLDIEIPDKIISPCELCGLFFNQKNMLKFLPYVRT